MEIWKRFNVKKDKTNGGKEETNKGNDLEKEEGKDDTNNYTKEDKKSDLTKLEKDDKKTMGKRR